MPCTVVKVWWYSHKPTACIIYPNGVGCQTTRLLRHFYHTTQNHITGRNQYENTEVWHYHQVTVALRHTGQTFSTMGSATAQNSTNNLNSLTKKLQYLWMMEILISTIYFNPVIKIITKIQILELLDDMHQTFFLKDLHFTIPPFTTNAAVKFAFWDSQNPTWYLNTLKPSPIQVITGKTKFSAQQ